MRIERVVRLFHDADGCPGIIVGDFDQLYCAECGDPVDLEARTQRPQPTPPQRPSAAREWVCPDCGNHYGLEDGVRYLTRTTACPCKSMPLRIRIMRVLKAQGFRVRAV